jgi:hypothetical protein
MEYPMNSQQTNPKGAGRPRGAKKKRPKITDAYEQTIIALSDAGKTIPEIAAEVGIHPRVVGRLLQDEQIRREGRADPEIDRSQLPLTAQQKLDAAIRQHKRKLELEFEIGVLEECKRRLDEISLPHYAKELEELERSITSRKGIMDRVTYRKILSCLHPDRVADPVLKKRYEEAFRLFTELEKRVLDERESPTEFRKTPRTYEELMAARQEIKERNRAKYAASRSGNVSKR